MAYSFLPKGYIYYTQIQKSEGVGQQSMMTLQVWMHEGVCAQVCWGIAKSCIAAAAELSCIGLTAVATIIIR